jgi:hypothetical protein
MNTPGRLACNDGESEAISNTGDRRFWKWFRATLGTM